MPQSPRRRQTLKKSSPASLAEVTKLRMGWHPDLPDHRDYPYAAMRLSVERPTQLASAIDLRPDFPTTYNQGTLNSCTANAIVGAFAFDVKTQDLPPLIPSRLYVYYYQRALIGNENVDSGGSIRDAIKAIAVYGICDESLWPYDEKQFTTEPQQPPCRDSAMAYLKDIELSYYSLDNTNLDQLKGCLAAGNVFTFGFTIYKSFHNADKDGIISMPNTHESVLGGHAAVAAGYDDSNQYFIIRSSWGDSVGKNGYYFMPYQYVINKQLSRDFWTVRTTKK
jgi:C1A family cysteine protease